MGFMPITPVTVTCSHLSTQPHSQSWGLAEGAREFSKTVPKRMILLYFEPVQSCLETLLCSQEHFFYLKRKENQATHGKPCKSKRNNRKGNTTGSLSSPSYTSWQCSLLYEQREDEEQHPHWRDLGLYYPETSWPPSTCSLSSVVEWPAMMITSLEL